MALTAGDRLGPYVIAGVLGAGGMGEVYRARDPRLDRDVAVKIVHAASLADPEWRTRFAQEAKAISALSHPNIVTIHDIGTHGDVAYMVMELVDGQTLERLIPASGMRLSDVLRIGAQIADACARAHAGGIIHRDLKPANIIVPADGRVRVLDFGIAKLVATAPATAGATAAPTGTNPGVVLGTAAYMSPEQAEGRPVDARSDIFSLGAVLYEMASGRRPFKADTPMATMAAVLNQEPTPVGELRPDLPPELARLIMRCLRKDPTRRVQSMADLKVALEDLRDDVTSGRLAAAVATPPRGPIAVLGRLVPVVVILGLLLAVVWVLRTWRPAQPVGTPQVLPLTSYVGTEAEPSFSPDGTQLAFRWNGERQDNLDIYVLIIGGSGSPLRLTTDLRPDYGPQWAPDGRSIAFLRVLDGERVALMLVPPIGGAERVVGQFFYVPSLGNSPTAELAWTPDSRYLLLAAAPRAGVPNQILRVDPESGEVVPLAEIKDRLGFTGLALSPDGRTLATGRFEGDHGMDLLALSPKYEAQQLKPFRTDVANVADLAWSPDGKSLWFSRYVTVPLPFFRAPLDGGDVAPLEWVGPGVVGKPAIHGSRMVFARTWRDTNILRLDLRAPGGAPAIDRIAQSSFRDVAPQYSPDGRRLVFYSNRSGSVQLWTANADGTQAVQLTSMDPLSTTGTPRWSPDGRQISFDSNVGGTYHLYVIGSDGGKARQLTSGAAADFVSFWSPDGQFVYFGSNRSGREEIWHVPAGGGQPQQVTSIGATAPWISADSRWLYFTKRDGAEGIWRMPLGGGPAEKLIDRVSRYSYQVTADGIYYVTPGPDAGLYYRELANGAVKKLTAIDKPTDLGVAVSPDGRYVLFTQIDYAGQDLMIAENVR